ncbi:MAG: chitobiase/beta-hexosaminidase C-terminal domain-containing protein [Victivallales bacterium]|nr:chitobiase/beta-hexosaminidase C-terminal domain-containing protein [Victivallales bacterium]
MMKRFLCIVCLFIVSFGNVLFGVSKNDIIAALDLSGQPGITLESFCRRVYTTKKYHEDDSYWFDYVDDNDGNPKYSTSSSNCWVVQSSSGDNSKYSTYPIKGESCLRSDLPTGLSSDSDAQEARLVFKVIGPGIFTFFYKTCCEDGDGIQVYVDRDDDFFDANAEFETSGYAEPMEDWSYTDEGESENRAEVTVYGEVPHEIMFVFTKDMPECDADTGNYMADGPEKPVKDDYNGDTEGYNEDLATYNSIMKCFNRVWLDWVKWKPLLSLEIEDFEGCSFDKEGNYLDEACVLLTTNAVDYGYRVRYTVDGSDPTSSSPEYDYGAPYLSFKQSCTLKAAIFADGKMDEEVGVVSMDVSIVASAPTLELDAEKTTGSAVIYRAANTVADNLIVYTTDGSEPTVESAVYDAEKGIVITSECTLTARCVREGVIASSTVSLSVERLPMPTYRLLDADNEHEEVPNGITTGNSLTLKADNSSGILKYGSFEDDISTDYTAPVTIGVGGTLYLRNVELGKLSSEIARVQVRKPDTTVSWGVGDYALEPGWNLVSFPLLLTNESQQKLLRNWKLLRYDSERQCYQCTTMVKPGCAYWLFQKNRGETDGIELSGCMATEAEKCVKGWNLMGPVNGQERLEGKEVWSYSNGTYVPLGSGEKPSLWKGYMVKD